MTARKPSRAQAAARDRLTDDRARIATCRRCSQPVLRALVGKCSAIEVACDPLPLDLQQEAAAIAEGRVSYYLLLRPWCPPVITDRHDCPPTRLGPQKHTVIADHACPGRPTTPATTPPDALF